MEKGWDQFPWSALLDWYEKNGRHDLSWRDYTMEDNIRAYRVWLSEIFLQQTQVERVRGYFTRIYEKYPTVHHLARASYEEFFPYYQGMGYYSRARNLLHTAAILSKEYGGVFPREKGLLEKLPGVGRYTSSALLAFAFGEAFLAWDTNLEKVFSRYYHGSRGQKLTEAEKEVIEADFRQFIHGYGGGKQGNRGSGGEIVGAKMIKEKGGAKRGGASFLPPETFGTFGHESTANGCGKIQLVRTINNALMDFAATIDLKNPENIDWKHYPITSGIFYETRGSLEPRAIKKSQSFPIPDAQIIVTLHRDHREYYSLKDEIYSPFILPPSLTRDTRIAVQEYFRTNFALELSVRPIEKKGFSDSGVPFVTVNAQIQIGVHHFSVFEKKGGVFCKKVTKEL